MTTIVALLFVLLFEACWAAPASDPTKSKPYLIRNDQVYDNYGQFALAYVLDDGTYQTKQGSLVLNDQGDDYVMNQAGSYSFFTPEGINVKMSYTADKDGFKVTGYPLPAAA